MKYDGILLAGSVKLSEAACESEKSLLTKTIEKSFPHAKVFYACTSRTLLLKYSTLQSLSSSLLSIKKQGVKNLRVLPLLFAPGKEWLHLFQELSKAKKDFHSLSLLQPLLSDEKNRLEIMKTIISENNLSPEKKVLLVGHGSWGEANKVYQNFEKTFSSQGFTNVRVRTLMDFSLDSSDQESLTLIPLFFSYGHHAEKDLFGEENSISSAIKNKGLYVNEVRQGLLETESFCSFLCKLIKDGEEWNEDF